MANRFIKLSTSKEDWSNDGKNFDPAENADRMAEIVSNINEHADDVEKLEELNEDISQQDKVIEDGQEVTVNDLVAAEAQFESFCNHFTGHGVRETRSQFHMESFGNQSVKEKYIINLENKKRLRDIAQEAIQKQDVGAGQKLKEFFVLGKREFQNYLKSMEETLKEVTSSQSDTLKEGIELSPETMALATSDIATASSRNFKAILDKKPRDGVRMSTSKLKQPDSWFEVGISTYIEKPKSKAKLDNYPLGFIPLGRQDHGMIGLMMTDDTTISMFAYYLDKDDKLTLTENAGKYDVSDLETKKLGFKNKNDVIKAIEKIINDMKQVYKDIDKAFGIFGQVKQSKIPHALGLGASMLGIIAPIMGPALDGLSERLSTKHRALNQIAHSQVRMARKAYNACKELQKLIKE